MITVLEESFNRLLSENAADSAQSDPISLAVRSSPVGPLLLGAVKDGICCLEFTELECLESQLLALRRLMARGLRAGRHRFLDQLDRELTEYFDGKRTEFAVPLFGSGTSFQESVWAELLRIPYGETRSYEDVATNLGMPQAPRAVGRANGQNRIAIVIPCHRVVNKGGKLGGYGGGLDRKCFLLDLESRVCGRSSQCLWSN